MSLQVGGLCFILLCSFLVASTLVIGENISSEEVKIDEWQTLTLLCNATEVPGATVLWIREDTRNITRLKSGEEFETVKEVVGFIEGEPLILPLFQREDKGAYICTARNGVDPSITKRFIVDVNYLPKITIPPSNRDSYGMYGDDAQFQCLVEAQPRGTNTWKLHPGGSIGANPAITLVNSSKYLVEETQQNEYTTLMKLTIRNFQRADYAIYSCSSSNRLGDVQFERTPGH